MGFCCVTIFDFKVYLICLCMFLGVCIYVYLCTIIAFVCHLKGTYWYTRSYFRWHLIRGKKSLHALLIKSLSNIFYIHRKVSWHIWTDFNLTPDDIWISDRKGQTKYFMINKIGLPSSMVEATTELDAGPVPCLL